MVQALSDSSFVAAVGVNTSITMISSAYQNYAQMMNALSYIGVTQVRDTYDNPFTTAEFALMNRQLGLKFDFFIALGSAQPWWQIQQIRTNPSIVSYVEGFNESDSWWQTYNGVTGIGATQAVQQYIYNAVHNDPTLNGVGVIQATFKDPSSFPAYGDMSAYADYASTHTYFGTGNNPSGSAGTMIAQAQTITPGRPTITTEAGYFTMPGNVHGVSQLVQAKYELDLLFEQAAAGVKLTYLWDLADNYNDPGNTNSEDHFGLFNNDWTPKLAAIALHNTMQIMADPGTGGVAPGTLNYNFDNLPSSVQSSLYQKSDGTFVLVVWNDVRLSGPTVQADIAVAPIATTLHLGSSFAHVAVFDPLTGTTAVQSFSNTGAINLQVVDHPLIIELSQNPGFQTPTNPIAGPDRIITNPLGTVQVDGLSIAGDPAALVTVQLHAAASALSIQDTTGRLLASDTSDITLAGTLATVDAELATLTYSGGSGLGSDTLTVLAAGSSGVIGTRSIGVTVQAGLPAANDSGGPAISVPDSFFAAAGSPLTLPHLQLADAYAATHGGTITLSMAASRGGTLGVRNDLGSVVGNGTSNVLVTGSFAQIVAMLHAVTYTGTANGATDTVTFSVTDQAGFSASNAIQMTVGPSIGSTLAPVVSATNLANLAVTPTPATASITTPATTTPITTTPVTTSTTTSAATSTTSTTTPATSATTAPITAAVVAAPVSAGSDGSVWRFFDTREGTQFLTSSASERDTILATRPDLVAEGVGIGAVTQPGNDPNAIGIYRFFDTGTGTHFYTSSSAERDSIEATRSDLTFEGTSFYEHQNAGSGDTAVYRFFNSGNGTHFYTASATERASILATRPDLVAEGIAFYAPTS